MKKLLISTFILLFAIQLTSAASFWVNNPLDCPSTNAINFAGQDCSPNDICGDSSGIAQCFDTSTISAPSGTASSNTDQDSGSFDGGYLINCFVTADSTAPFCDNSGSFWCDRNSTCFSTNFRATTCTADVFGVSTCGSCRSGYNDCNTDGGVCEILNGASCGTNAEYLGCSGSSGDCICSSNKLDCDVSGPGSGNGCEISVGASCGSGTGTYASACNGAEGNCTASANKLDCDNDDSDSDEGTCNGDNGCEITVGGACTVGSLSGTYSSCSGGAGLCVVSQSDFRTGNETSYSTDDALLWGSQYGGGYLVNLTNGTVLQFGVNNSGCIVFSDGTTQCTSDEGSTTDVIWVNDSTITYINSTYPQNVNFTGNLTLGQRIIFSFGEVIDNIVDSWIRITGSLNVTNNLEVGGNVTVGDSLFVDTNLIYATGNKIGFRTSSISSDHDFDFNGNLRIQGDLDVVGNFTSLSVQNLFVNGSILPEQDTIFDIGNSTKRFRNGSFSGTLEVGTDVVVSGKSVCLDDGTNCILGTSITNTEIESNSINTTQIIDGTITADDLDSSSVNTTHIVDGTITDTDISDSTNLTLGQKIVFALGGFIQNIISGRVDINGTLNVTNDLIVGGDLNVSGIIYGNGSGLTNLPWAELTGVPSVFSDGVDNNTLYFADGIYIYNNGTDFFFLNETKLNSTIDSRNLWQSLSGETTLKNPEPVNLSQDIILFNSATAIRNSNNKTRMYIASDGAFVVEG